MLIDWKHRSDLVRDDNISTLMGERYFQLFKNQYYIEIVKSKQTDWFHIWSETETVNNEIKRCHINLILLNMRS